MKRWGVVVVGLVLVACSSTDGVSSPPQTLAQRCAQSCTAPTATDNPCKGQPTPSGCASTCETTLAGKSDDCVSCYLGYSGWQGTTCECTTVIVDLSCSACTYHGGSRSCSTELNDKCSSGQSCTGWVPVEIDDPVCATKCGQTPNLAIEQCKTACLSPRGADDPCRAATAEQENACLDLCTTKLRGKSQACLTCYFGRAVWAGSTCSCQGSDCTKCNVYSNVGGPVQTCGTAACTTGSQCDGFQEIAIDQCAADCGPL